VPPPPYRYKVKNGMRITTIELKQHIPSHMYIAGHRKIISYTGQLATCYICNATDHISQHCPQRIMKYTPPPPNPSLTRAQLFVMSANGHQTGPSQAPGRKTTESTDNRSHSTVQPSTSLRKIWRWHNHSHPSPQLHEMQHMSVNNPLDKTKGPI
jgi:hypothetical protein